MGSDISRRQALRSARLSPLALSAAVAAAMACATAEGATKYFDVTAGAGNGVGGTGTLAAQTTALFSTTATGDATLTAAVQTDDLVFQGTAGTVTFGAAYNAASATFGTTGYVLTTSSSTGRIFNAPITLLAGINLNLIEATQTGDRTLGLGSISGGAGSTITIEGMESGSNSARINLAVTGATVAVPTSISGGPASGTALAGYVATATGTSVTSTIANNSTFTTLLGATSGFDLTLSTAAVISGTAGVQISAGSSGGAGLVTINSTNTYGGSTIINNSTTGVVRLGTDNALPATTALQFGIGSNATGSLDLNGHTQTVASLAVTGTAAVNGIVNTSATTANLVVNGSATTNFNSSIGIPASTTSANLTGANNAISLTLASGNTGTLALSGANNYSSGTTILGGTLRANTTAAVGSATGSGPVSVGDGINASSGTLAGGTTSAVGHVAGTITVNAGGTITAGTGRTAGDTIGTLTTAGQVWAGGGIYAAKFASTDGATVTSNDKLIMSSLSLTGGPFTVNVIGLTVNAGAPTLGTNKSVAGGSILIATDNDTVGVNPFNATAATLATEFSLNTTGLTVPTGYAYQLDSQQDTANGGGYDLIVDLAPTAAPEPTSLLLAGIAAVPLAISRRRRRA